MRGLASRVREGVFGVSSHTPPSLAIVSANGYKARAFRPGGRGDGEARPIRVSRVGVDRRPHLDRHRKDHPESSRLVGGAYGHAPGRALYRAGVLEHGGEFLGGPHDECQRQHRVGAPVDRYWAGGSTREGCPVGDGAGVRGRHREDVARRLSCRGARARHGSVASPRTWTE